MPLTTRQDGLKFWQWDAHSKTRLKELLEAGHSAGDTADILSKELGTPITRNSVIGAKHRMAIKQGERKPTVRKPPRKPVSWRSPHQPTGRPYSGEQIPHPPRTLAVAFVDRQPHQCSFPVEGSGINMRCCGAKRYEYGGLSGPGIKHTKFPYCWYHCNVAYRWQQKAKAA